MCFKLYIGWEPGWNRKQKEQKWSLCIIQIISSPGTRAVDPDPRLFFFLDPNPDPHLLYYADPDSGGENFRKKTEKCKEIGRNCNFIIKY